MIRASAPGSIMITGEHAVVYGHRAVVAAIEQRITVELAPRDDRVVTIRSSIADTLETSLDNLAEGGVYKFVLAAVALHRNALNSGFDLSIASEIDPTLGLGSSAAVTVAVLGALKKRLGQDMDDVHANALAIVRAIQGRGSGADLAASCYGGMISYRSMPSVEWAPLPNPPQLSLRYAGYKTPTSEVLQMIAARMKGSEDQFDRLYAKMGDEADQAIAAAHDNDWQSFAQSLTQYQCLMTELGVSDGVLDQIVQDTSKEPEVLAAKISGSGLGDCVVALGACPSGFTPAPIAQQGLVFDE
ncbi:mevalonate kinase [Cognatishimia activa]|uniref:mevalonate kinase n=1 Tax=Cognatishimia activa TaxID=1715691 RepID=UPI0022328465|nr:mevalonate kinase [Cognatishimia activa]UZD90625.1 mevalonate kinase [Cognatishimia activa]